MANTRVSVKISPELHAQLIRLADETDRAHVRGLVSLPNGCAERCTLQHIIQICANRVESHRARGRKSHRRARAAQAAAKHVSGEGRVDTIQGIASDYMIGAYI
jgi:hypothetical protein